MNFNVFVLFATAKVSWADAVEDPDYPMPPLVFKDQKLDNKYMFSTGLLVPILTIIFLVIASENPISPSSKL